MIAVSIFLLFYVIDVVGMSQAEAQRFIGQALAILGVALLLCAIPAKQLVDQVSRKKLVFASGLIACTGTIVILLTREYAAMMIGGALVGAGVGIYMYRAGHSLPKLSHLGKLHAT